LRVQGSILQVNSSRGGLPKRATLAGFVDTLGLEGDGQAHPTIHGGPRKAILLIAAEIIDELAARGYPVFYGAMGENLTARGIDIRALRVGDRLRAGGALLEITQPRGPCTALDVYGPSIKDEIYDLRVKLLDATSPRWGMSGLYASVIEAGEVRPGDQIELLAQA
jgi:MOSC domain-containing protein YiiM